MTKKRGQSRHPYEAFEGTPVWKTVEKAIGDLVENSDIEEKTARHYIVGYLCNALRKKDL